MLFIVCREGSIFLENGRLFIPRGGSCKEAEIGVKKLAEELKSFIAANDLLNTAVVLPSGEMCEI
jgi:hypothetical protein